MSTIRILYESNLRQDTGIVILVHDRGHTLGIVLADTHDFEHNKRKTLKP